MRRGRTNIGVADALSGALEADIADSLMEPAADERVVEGFLLAGGQQIRIGIGYLSNLICQSNGDRNAEGEKSGFPPADVLKRLGIKADQYEIIAEKALGWMDKLSETLSFE